MIICENGGNGSSRNRNENNQREDFSETCSSFGRVNGARRPRKEGYIFRGEGIWTNSQTTRMCVASNRKRKRHTPRLFAERERRAFDLFRRRLKMTRDPFFIHSLYRLPSISSYHREMPLLETRALGFFFFPQPQLKLFVWKLWNVLLYRMFQIEISKFFIESIFFLEIIFSIIRTFVIYLYFQRVNLEIFEIDLRYQRLENFG